MNVQWDVMSRLLQCSAQAVKVYCGSVYATTVPAITEKAGSRSEIGWKSMGKT